MEGQREALNGLAIVIVVVVVNGKGNSIVGRETIVVKKKPDSENKHK